MPNLALFDETRHRPDCFFNWHRSINSVLIVKVNHINAKPCETFLIGDRESDIYELFCAAQDAGTLFPGADVRRPTCR